MKMLAELEHAEGPILLIWNKINEEIRVQKHYVNAEMLSLKFTHWQVFYYDDKLEFVWFGYDWVAGEDYKLCCIWIAL